MLRHQNRWRLQLHKGSTSCLILTYSITPLQVSVGTVPENCLDNCIYSRDGKPGSEYCFASGQQKVQCLTATLPQPLYPDVYIVNSLCTSVTVSVHYPTFVCGNDNDKGIAPGLSISLSRGICLVTGVYATKADGTVCGSYGSSGTSYSNYAVITVPGGGCMVTRIVT